MVGMDSIYPPIVNFLARVIYSIVILLYGWFAGGVAGLLAMAFVVAFLVVGMPAVVADSILGSVWAAVKWFGYFLAYHFLIYIIDEPLSDAMLVFLAGTLGAIERWIRGVSEEELLGFFIGVMLVGGAIWLLGKWRG